MHRNRLAAALLGTTALLAVATAAVAQPATTPVQPGINATANGAAGLTASGLRDKAVYTTPRARRSAESRASSSARTTSPTPSCAAACSAPGRRSCR